MPARFFDTLSNTYAAWRKSSRVSAVVLVILLLGFTLRVYGLTYEEVEGDEAFSYIFSIDSLDGIVRTTLANGEPHPVASYFLDHFWLQLAGHSEFAFRFPSVWFGVLAVAVIFRFSRRLHLRVTSSRDAIPALAALLIALSPFLIQVSRNGRMYSMSLCLSMLSAWLALELIQAPPGNPPATYQGLRRLLSTWLSWRATLTLLAYILVSWVALNTHYFTGTILLAENVFVLIVLLKRSLRKQLHVLARWVIAELAVLAAFVPWYLLVRDILSTYRGIGSYARTIDFVFQRMAGALTVGLQSDSIVNFYAYVALAVAVLGLIRLALSGRQQRYAAIYLLLLVLVPCFMAWLDARERATFTERQLIGIATGFMMLLAAGISFTWNQLRSRPRTALPGLFAGILLAGSLVGLFNYYNKLFSAPSTWRAFIGLVQRYSANMPREQLRGRTRLSRPRIDLLLRRLAMGNHPPRQSQGYGRRQASSARPGGERRAARDRTHGPAYLVERRTGAEYR